MSQYRILKGNQAILCKQNGDWIVPFRIQKKVTWIPLIWKRWEWVTGKHIRAEHLGERVEIVETYDDPINFETEEKARLFIVQQLAESTPETVEWEIVSSFKMK